jgi:hypothetical protein
MKRGRKSRAELAALGQRPADLREPWQIEQAARCGCKGTDDLCPCQNENPWPRPFIDWKTRAEAAEAQLTALKEEVERLKAELAMVPFEMDRDQLLDQIDYLQADIARKDAALTEAPIISKYHGVRGFEADRFIADYNTWSVTKRAALQPQQDIRHLTAAERAWGEEAATQGLQPRQDGEGK